MRIKSPKSIPYEILKKIADRELGIYYPAVGITVYNDIYITDEYLEEHIKKPCNCDITRLLREGCKDPMHE